MRCFLSVFLGLLAFVLIALSVDSQPQVAADTVYLKNGRTLHGAFMPGPGEDHARVVFRNGGSVILRRDDVVRIADNDLDAFETETPARTVPSAERKAVRVTLKEDFAFYGTGSYAGWLAPSDDESILVLDLPGGGRLSIPRRNVASIEEVATDAVGLAPALEPAERTIATTHQLTLKNGRIIRGTLVPTGPSEPVEIRVGQLGTLRFPRDAVEKIEEVEGSVELPAPPEEVEPPAPELPEIPPEVIEELKRQLRREILREILEGIIDDKVDEAVDEAIERETAYGIHLPAGELTAEEILEAEFHVRELGRQRTQNRVRAEAALKRLGPGVLPYLIPAASHPFELTRRAAMRIVRELGDARGAPLAIERLDDPDAWVRRLAHDALTALLDPDIPFDADGPARARRQAQERYRELWLEIARSELRKVARERARAALAG